MIPEIVLTLTNGETEWKIGIVGRCAIDREALTVTLPCPYEPGEKIVLSDWLIVEFARERMNGLRLISERPLTEPAATDARQDAERHSV